MHKKIKKLSMDERRKYKKKRKKIKIDQKRTNRKGENEKKWGKKKKNTKMKGKMKNSTKKEEDKEAERKKMIVTIILKATVLISGGSTSSRCLNTAENKGRVNRRWEQRGILTSMPPANSANLEELE